MFSFFPAAEKTQIQLFHSRLKIQWMQLEIVDQAITSWNARASFLVSPHSSFQDLLKNLLTNSSNRIYSKSLLDLLQVESCHDTLTFESKEKARNFLAQYVDHTKGLCIILFYTMSPAVTHNLNLEVGLYAMNVSQATIPLHDVLHFCCTKKGNTCRSAPMSPDMLLPSLATVL